MEAESGPDAPRPTLPLLQVGLRRPDGRVVRHVVVRRKQLHLDFTRVDDEDDVVDGDARLGDVG